ncbi:MAG: hypothetical protein MSIBF_03290 [Candidatus Altiarchaeales archaeon IMC4]|nr:MAG: hypothetical protein MSIBF_03290 [Candidatus Altiarchaeales archaeon IMC4]
MKMNKQISKGVLALAIFAAVILAAADGYLKTNEGDVIIQPASGVVRVDGKVGIGTDDPSATLDVTGNIAINGKSISDYYTYAPKGQTWYKIKTRKRGVYKIVATGDYAEHEMIVHLISGHWSTAEVTILSEYNYDHKYIKIVWGYVGSGPERYLAFKSVPITADYSNGIYIRDLSHPGLSIELEEITNATTVTEIKPHNQIYVDEVGGKVGIGTTSPSQKLDVIGNVRADDFIEYSSAYASEDALGQIMNIACEEGTEHGKWCDVDHDTLPEGVKVVVKEKRLKDKRTGEIKRQDEVAAGIGGGSDETLEGEDAPSAENLLDDYEEIEVDVDGRSMSRMVQVLVKGVQELKEENDLLKQELCRKDKSYGFCNGGNGKGGKR